MPDRPRRPPRWLAPALVVAVALGVAACRPGAGPVTGSEDPRPGPATTGSPAASPTPAATQGPTTGPTSPGPRTGSSPSPGFTDDGVPAALADPATAAELPAEVLYEAVARLVADRDDLVVGGHGPRVAAAAATGPVVVADVVVDAETVSAHVVVAIRDPDDEVVFRLLAASEGVPAASGRLQLQARTGGRELDVAIEPHMDRVRVDLAGISDDAPIVLDLQLSYPIPDRDDLLATRGPAGYGLLADHGDVVTLGHWLPAPVAIPGNDGDVPEWGDLGAFDAGTWVVRTHHPATTFRTGGVDRSCPPRRAAACTLSIGLGLRDLAAALFTDERPVATATIAGVPGATVAATSTLGGDGEIATLSAEQLDWLAATWGPLAWPEFDVVAAEISPAAGMEFPGMVIMDESTWSTDPTATFVLIHEWAHQHFHGWVGNGSLSDPGVDEPLAQYASWRWYLDRDGPETAAAVARAAFDTGEVVDPQPPGLAADEYRDADSYTAAIYGTAARAWVDAADAHGVAAVDAVVAAIVDRHGLGELDTADLLAVAAEVAPEVGADLRAAFTGG